MFSKPVIFDCSTYNRKAFVLRGHNSNWLFKPLKLEILTTFNTLRLLIYGISVGIISGAGVLVLGSLQAHVDWCWNHFRHTCIGVGIISWTWVLVLGSFHGRGYWCWDFSWTWVLVLGSFMDVGTGVGIFHERGYWCWDHFMDVGTGVGIISWTWVLVLGSFHGRGYWWWDLSCAQIFLLDIF